MNTGSSHRGCQLIMVGALVRDDIEPRLRWVSDGPSQCLPCFQGVFGWSLRVRRTSDWPQLCPWGPYTLYLSTLQRTTSSGFPCLICLCDCKLCACVWVWGGMRAVCEGGTELLRNGWVGCSVKPTPLAVPCPICNQIIDNLTPALLFSTSPSVPLSSLCLTLVFAPHWILGEALPLGLACSYQVSVVEQRNLQPCQEASC